MPKSNSVHARGISLAEPTDATWVILDALPPLVRHAIHQAPMSINPASAWTMLHDYGMSPDEAAGALYDAAAQATRQFSEQHRQAHGYVLPHLAARVSFQPYEAARRGTRRHGKRQGRTLRRWQVPETREAD